MNEKTTLAVKLVLACTLCIGTIYGVVRFTQYLLQ